MMQSSNQIVAVLSMYRSGNTVLSDCLTALGFRTAHTIDSANFDKNNFSNNISQINIIHSTLFSELGCKWDMVGNLPVGWMDSHAAHNATTAIDHYLHIVTEKNVPFALVDPALCRFFPLWLRSFKSLNITPAIVVLLRHPMEVAYSLKTKFDLELDKGHLLWMNYNRDALRSCRNLDYSIVSYDQIVANPINALQGILNSINFGDYCLNSNYGSLFQYIHPELKHHAINSSFNDDKFFSHFNTVYNQLLSFGVRSTLSRDSSDDSMVQYYPLVGLHELNASTSPLSHSSADNIDFSLGVFNRLLDLIGDYEKKQLNVSTQRDFQLLKSSQLQQIRFCHFYIDDKISPAGSRFFSQEAGTFVLNPGEWQNIIVDFDSVDRYKLNGLKFSPTNSYGIVQISSLKIFNKSTDSVLREYSSLDDFFSIMSLESSYLLPVPGCTTILCSDISSMLNFNIFDDIDDVPLAISIWIKVDHDVSKIGSIISDYQDKLENKIASCTALENQIVQQSSDYDKLVQLNSSLDAKCACYQKQISDLKESYDFLAESKNNSILQVKKDVSSLLSQLSSQQIEHDKVKADLSTSQKTISYLQSQLDSLSSEKNLEISRLASELSEINNLNDDLQKNILNISSELELKIYDIATKDKIISQLNKTINDNSKKNADETDKIVAELNEYKTASENFRNQISDLNAELKVFKKKLQDLNAKHDASQKSNSSLQKDVDRLNSLNVHSQQIISDFELRLVDEKSKYQHLKDVHSSEIQILNNRFAFEKQTLEDSLRKAIDYKEQILDTLRLERESQIQIKNELNDTSSRLSSTLAELDNLKLLKNKISEDLEHHAEINANTEQMLNDATLELAKLRSELESANAINKELSQEIEIERNSLLEARESLAIYANDLMSCKDDIEEHKALLLEYEENVHKLHSELDFYRSQVQSFIQRQSDFDAQLASCQQMCSVYKNDIDMLHSDYKQQINGLVLELHNAKKNHDLIQQQYLQQENYSINLNNSLAEFKNQYGSQIELTKAYYTLNVDLEEQLERLQIQISDCNSSLESEKQALMRAKSDLLNAREWRDEVRRLHANLRNAKRDLLNARNWRDQNRQFSKWFHELDNDFKLLLKSRRWRMGCFFGKLIDVLLLRRTSTAAVERMNKIFNDSIKD